MLTEALKYEPWVLIGIDKELYGLPAKHVREMLQAPDATRVPMMPEHFRGVINLRGAVMPLVDLRNLLGMASSMRELDELIENLNKREQDHKNWIANLEKSVIERKAFNGELDPHKCAFGLWYDNFTTDNVFLKRVLVMIDAPHQRIHALATKVKAFEAQGKFDAALKMIEEARFKELSKLVELFDETRETLREYAREIVVVLSAMGMNIALTVDTAMTVEKLDPDSFNEMVLTDYTEGAQVLAATARRKNTGELVMLFDTDILMNNIMSKNTLSLVK
ncbi:MAG: chemotaxis protein CheW [bacterium]